LAIVLAILNWAARRRPPLLAFNPVAGYRLPKIDKPNHQPTTIAEVNAILAEAPDHLKRFVKPCFYMGARPGAKKILAITWDRFNFEGRTILAKSAMKGGPQWRAVAADLYPDLLVWHKQDGGRGHLVHWKGRPIKRVLTAWQTAKKKAGIKRNIRPYDLRHHFISAALAAGHGIKSVSEVVGSSPKTLMDHYQHVTSQQHVQVVHSIPSLGIPGDTKYPKMSDFF
jgi:integrase